MTLQVESPTVYTSQGVPISVTGIAQVILRRIPKDNYSRFTPGDVVRKLLSDSGKLAHILLLDFPIT